MKKKKTIIINALIIIVILAGLVLLFNVPIRDFLISKNSQRYTIENVTLEEIEENERVSTTFDFEDVDYISSSSVVMAQINPKKLPVIGKIAIPELGVNLAIFKGLSNDALLNGAGTMSESQKMGQGNYAVASHRMSNPNLLFSPIERAQAGQLIYLTDLEKIYIYQVIFCATVADTEVQYLEEDSAKNLLTLVTCGDMKGDTRIIVQAELIDIKNYQDASSEIRGYFNGEK